MILVLVLVLVGGSAYYYFNYIATRKSASFADNNMSDSQQEGMEGDADAELIMFYVDWCPHCKTAKPEWEKVRDKYNGTTVNGYNVTFTEVNCTEETPDVQEMTEQYNIEGYPTIKLVRGDQVVDFEAKPTETTLIQFLTTVLN